MKTNSYIRFITTLFIGTLFIVLFTSYGNKKVHPDLNSLMLNAFLKQNNKGDLSQNDFKKYMFFFENGVTLKGTAIVKDGLFSAGDIAAAGFGYGYSEEGSAEMTVKEWIVNGGYSADVPEVPASLRHFYDPTRPEGERYLTDITNAKIMGSLQKYVLTNPHIDGVQWALGTPGDHSTSVQDHQYTWERGKLWMQMALKETNENKKNEYMAKAWRSLGETLHMIADNGCPPHVRNDAHPSPLWGNNNWFGNPDPYEELVDIIRRDQSEEFMSFANGSPDPDLKGKFSTMTKARDIAHMLAVFTNNNFVTNETISGTDRMGTPKRQITHPEYPYPAPLLEGLSYNESDYSYNSAIGVKECVDHYYFASLIPKMCDPYVDMECVKSQARVLFPNIIEAGKNVIKLYIPKLSVEINSLEKGVLKGVIKHKTESEYPTEIKYTGEVTLTIKDKNFRVKDKITATANNGIIRKDGINLAKDERLIASISFGGIVVESPEFIGGDDNIFGVYQGPYIMTINEANMLQMYIDKARPNANANEETRKAAVYDAQNLYKIWKEDVNGVKGGTFGGPIVRFAVEKNGIYSNDYDLNELKYYVINLNNYAFLPNYLTPLKNKSNPGTMLEFKNNGFCIHTTSGGINYVVNGNFKGNDLVGDWKASCNGKILWSSTFTAKKISGM